MFETLKCFLLINITLKISVGTVIEIYYESTFNFFNTYL